MTSMQSLGDQLIETTAFLLDHQFDNDMMAKQFEIAAQMVNKERTENTPLEELSQDLQSLLVASHALHEVAETYRLSPANSDLARWCFETAQSMLKRTAEIITLTMAKQLGRPTSRSLN